MLVEIAVADAYGAGFEFSSNEKISKFNDLTRYYEHDLYRMKGKYTDDTQMSIAIAELLLSQSLWSKENIASKFVDCFKRDPRYGYSKGFYQLLVQVNSGEELICKLRNNSSRNGAAMRSVPLGFIKNKEELIFKAKMQAAITHDTEDAVRASCAIALAAHFGLHMKGVLSGLRPFLEKESVSGWNYNWNGEVSVKAFDTVSAVFHCLLSCNNIRDLLQKCVSLGGDTDSVASIAVGLATCFDEYDKKLPQILLNTFDEPLYGLQYLESIDKKLFQYASL